MWAAARLSALAHKMYTKREAAERETEYAEHSEQFQTTLNVLLSQRDDLSTSIDELLADIESGKKYMKVYKQMKMYNDPNLNPVFYNKA